MKKLFFALLFFIPALAFSQITTAAGNSVPLSADAEKVNYVEPTIYISPTVLESGVVRVKIRAVTSSGLAESYMDFSAAYINGLSGSGSTIDKFVHACADGVIANLAALYGSNPFTNTYP